MSEELKHRTLRWGIAGCGFISHDFTNALRILTDSTDSKHTIVACAARKIEDANTFGEKFGIPTRYGSYKELTMDKNIDVVYVGLINPQHYPICAMMLRRGKAVLCEKPMTLVPRDTDALIRLSSANNAFLMEGFWSRCFPIYDKLRQLTGEAGKAGEVKCITAEFGFPMENIPSVATWSLGGGALNAIGCYGIQLATMLYDEMPESVSVSGKISVGGVDLWENITLKYSRERLACFFIHIGRVLSNSANIYCEKKHIEMNNFWSPTTLKIVDINTNESEVFEVKLPKARFSMQLPNSEGFVYEADCVKEAIFKGKLECDVMPHRHSVIIARVMAEISRQLGVQEHPALSDKDS